MVQEPTEIYLRVHSPKYLVRLLLPFIWAGMICWLSLTPSSPQISGFWGWDKFLHAGAYGLLSLLSAQFICMHLRSAKRAGLYAALLATIYGGTLEILQLVMQAGRSAEWWDLVADAIGAAGGSVLFCLIVMVVTPHRD